jgi:hypothetical protein
LLQWFNVFLSIKGQGTLDHGGGELVGENFVVDQILKELVKEKGEACTMDGKRLSKPFMSQPYFGQVWG